MAINLTIGTSSRNSFSYLRNGRCETTPHLPHDGWEIRGKAGKTVDSCQKRSAQARGTLTCGWFDY